MAAGTPSAGAGGLGGRVLTTADRYGPWAVIAGGSEGVGAALATHLADAGVSSVLVARDAQRLSATAAAVENGGAQARTVALDLSAADAAARLAAATADLEVGLLVCNAGANEVRGEVLDADPAGLHRVIDVNVRTSLDLVHHFAAGMRARGRGGVILVGSTAGFVGQPGHAVYAAAKAFTRVFCEGLWVELAPHGVHVLHAVLGLTRTPAMQRAGLRFDLPGVPAAEPDDVARQMLAALPHGPVWLAPGTERAAEALSAFPRDRVVQRNAKVVRALVEG